MTPPNLSLVFVMICFWITLWIVYRFLIRPVTSVVDERRRRIDDAQQEWSAKNEEFLAAVAKVEDEVAGAARDASKIRSDLRQHAMEARQMTLDEARARSDERLDAVLVDLDREADSVRSDLRSRVEDLARLLAGRLLGRELGT